MWLSFWFFCIVFGLNTAIMERHIMRCWLIFGLYWWYYILSIFISMKGNIKMISLSDELFSEVNQFFICLMKVKTKLRLRQIVLSLLFIVYVYWVEYSDFGKTHYDVLGNTRFPLMVLILVCLYFDEKRYKKNKG